MELPTMIHPTPTYVIGVEHGGLVLVPVSATDFKGGTPSQRYGLVVGPVAPGAVNAGFGGSGGAGIVINDLTTGGTAVSLSAQQGIVLSNAVTQASNAASAAQTSANTAQSTALLADSNATAAATTANAAAAAVAGKANVASPALTGTPTAPTAAGGTNTTQLATTAFVTAAVAAINSGLPTATTFGQSIQFDGYRSMGEQNVAGALTFTVNATGAVDTGETIMSLIADGVNAPNFSSFIAAGSQGYVNVAGQVNNISFFRDFGRYYYGIVLGPAIDLVAPTLVSAAVSNSTPGRIDLTWSEPMNSTMSATSAFAVSAGHALTAHTYLDSTHSYLTTSTNFVNGEVARTLAYTQPGSNKMQDLSGNLVANIASAAITNNVAAFVPNTPTALASSAQTSSSITLTMTASVVDGTHSAATDYVYEYRTPAGSGTYNVFADGTSPTPGTVITGLSTSTSYGIRAKATNAAGSSGYTSEITVSTAGSGRSDNFTRADSASALGTPSDGGSAWVADAGTWGITSNEGYCVSGGNVLATLATSGGATSYTLTYTARIASGGEYAGPAFRVVDASNFFRIQIDPTDVYLIKKVAGSDSTVATVSRATTLTSATSHTFVIAVTPTSITVTLDGVALTGLTTADTTFSTATKAGLAQYAGGGNFTRYTAVSIT